MVVYGGHAPIPNRWEFEFEMGAKFKMELEFKFEHNLNWDPEFEKGS